MDWVYFDVSHVPFDHHGRLTVLELRDVAVFVKTSEFV